MSAPEANSPAPGEPSRGGQPSADDGRSGAHARQPARGLNRQAEALERLVYVLDPSKKPKKRGLARLMGFFVLSSSIVLGGYEFVSWVIDQWQRREMISNWVEVAREMQDVENAPEVALEMLAKADDLDPQSTDVVRLRAYVRGMQTVKRLLELDRPFSASDVAAAGIAAGEASLLEQLDPLSPDWALLRGQLAMAQNEPDRATSYLEEALRLDPGNVLVRVRLAQIHMTKGRAILGLDPDAAKRELEMAGNLLDEAAAYDPKSKLVWLYRGEHQFFDLEDAESALASYDKAIAIDPRFRSAILNRGIIHFVEEDWPKAEDSFRRALEVEPGSVSVLGMMSQLYGRKDQYESALLYARKATEADPQSLRAWTVLGDVTRDMSTVEREAGHEETSRDLLAQAISAYGKAIDLDPRNSDVLIERSKAFRRAGDLAAAGRDVRLATELSPEDPYAWLALAEYQQLIEELPAALASAGRAIAIKDDMDFAHRIRAEILERQGDFENALASHGRAIESAEDDQRADLLRGRAEFLERRGTFEAALVDIRAARSMQPESFDFWVIEARLLTCLSRNEEACAALTEANQRRPGEKQVAELRNKAGCS